MIKIEKTSGLQKQATPRTTPLRKLFKRQTSGAFRSVEDISTISQLPHLKTGQSTLLSFGLDHIMKSLIIFLVTLGIVSNIVGATGNLHT